MSKNELNIVLTGGGTGGHVIPAIAIAEELERRDHSVCFIGTRGRLEAELVPKAGFQIRFIRARPLMGKTVGGVAAGLLAVPGSVAQAALLLKMLNAELVMGVGGYVAGPVVLAAALLRLPTAILEQNASLGFANRALARVSDRAFICYERLLDRFPKGRAVLTGNPLKASLLDAAEAERRQPTSGPLNVLVMGGSQGARAIDEWVPAAFLSAALNREIRVLHQCGPNRQVEVESAYRAASIEAEVTRFIEDTAGAYRSAHLVVARSGATTVSEISAMGLPAIFLPYPHHRDKQQHLNAEPMRQSGAAIVVDEHQDSVAVLAQAIEAFVNDDDRRQTATAAARRLGRPQATAQIVDALLELVQVVK